MSFHCVHTSRKGTSGSPEMEMRCPSGQRPTETWKTRRWQDSFGLLFYADLLSWLCVAAQTEALRWILNAPSALIWQVWVHLRTRPLYGLLAKVRRYDSQSGSGMELASVPNEQSASELRHVRRYVLGGTNSFPRKAEHVCWHLASAENFQLSFFFPSFFYPPSISPVAPCARALHSFMVRL